MAKTENESTFSLRGRFILCVLNPSDRVLYTFVRVHMEDSMGGVGGQLTDREGHQRSASRRSRGPHPPPTAAVGTNQPSALPTVIVALLLLVATSPARAATSRQTCAGTGAPPQQGER